MMDCFICLQPCIIPIQLKSFSCYKENEISCNTIQRICLPCYLKSDLKKCSYCHSEKTDRRNEIDFSLIMKDDFSIYSCPFCNEFQGNHIHLWKHMNEHCIFQCPCSKIILKKDLKKHYEEECSQLKWCTQCEKGVQFCPHIKCKICKKTNHTEEECSERLIDCKECFKKIKAKDYIEHYLEHIETIKTKMEFFKESLKSEKLKYYHLMEKIPELYESVYNERMLE